MNQPPLSPSHIGFGLAAVFLAAPPALAQMPNSEPAFFQVETTRTIALPGEDRSLILQRVQPPVLPVPLQAAQEIPEESTVETNTQTEEALAPRERRLLFLSATVYDNGFSYLQWRHTPASGEGKNYAAWSGTDFRSLWLVPQFEVNDVEYSVLPLVAREGSAPAASGPLAFPVEGPGFLVVDGDATDAEALAPITALHVIYREEGLQLAATQIAHDQRLADEAEQRRLNPPAPRDTIVRFWPIQSTVFADEISTTPATSNPSEK